MDFSDQIQNQINSGIVSMKFESKVLPLI